MNREEVEFLTLAEVVEIHKNQVELYGGDPLIRDFNLLNSAIYFPQSTFDGHLLHGDIYGMAASYIYHICQNHPFLDGNKRTALVCGLIFLDMNGIEIDDPPGLLYRMMMKVASGRCPKNEIAETLKRLAETV
ncbi:MAG TPA: type II toxin-antitoxin system death-on-curing family toxin [Spirochaetota bacterium]|nr:type II toxin-antitoxin system death-on-curing family toxin [Spirochaetota bacterium]